MLREGKTHDGPPRFQNQVLSSLGTGLEVLNTSSGCTNITRFDLADVNILGTTH